MPNPVLDINEVSRILSKLTSLTYLNIRVTEFGNASDVEYFSSLKNLKFLSVSADRTHITDQPAFTAAVSRIRLTLTNLQTLDIRGRRDLHN